MQTTQSKHPRIFPAAPQARACTRGFTLIEVLTAILILTLGAGGIVTMQVHAQRMTQESGFQTSATQLAAELAERMREQPADAYLFSFQAVSEGSSTPAADCHRNACDPASMASFVLSDWQQQLQQQLPQARATVCRDNPADTQRWECDQQGSSAVVIKIGWSGRTQHSEAPGVVLVTGL